jgi:hypothetical protein
MRVVRNGEVEPTLEKAKAQALAIRRAAVAYGRTPVVEGIDDDPPQHRHHRARPQRRLSPARPARPLQERLVDALPLVVLEAQVSGA